MNQKLKKLFLSVIFLSCFASPAFAADVRITGWLVDTTTLVPVSVISFGDSGVGVLLEDSNVNVTGGHVNVTLTDTSVSVLNQDTTVFLLNQDTTSFITNFPVQDTRAVQEGLWDVSINNQDTSVVLTNQDTTVYLTNQDTTSFVTNFPVQDTDVVVTNFPVQDTDVVVTNFPAQDTTVVVTNFPAQDTTSIVTNFPVQDTDVVVTNFPAQDTNVYVTNQVTIDTNVVVTNFPVQDTNVYVVNPITVDTTVIVSTGTINAYILNQSGTTEISGDIFLDSASLRVEDSDGHVWDIDTGGAGRVIVDNIVAQDTNVVVTNFPATVAQDTNIVVTNFPVQDTTVFVTNFPAQDTNVYATITGGTVNAVLTAGDVGGTISTTTNGSKEGLDVFVINGGGGDYYADSTITGSSTYTFSFESTGMRLSNDGDTEIIFAFDGGVPVQRLRAGEVVDYQNKRASSIIVDKGPSAISNVPIRLFVW